MSSLQNQKRRIKSVNNTLNIANAMELVSSVKLKKLRSYYLNCREYYIEKSNAIKQALSSMHIEVNKGEEEWVVILTSSLGLCGNYNEEVIKVLEESDFNNKKLIVLGDKGISYFKDKKIAMEKVYFDYNEFTSKEIGEFLIKRVEQGLIKSIEVVYTRYKNNFIHKSNKEFIYPFKIESNSNNQYILETNVKELISMYISDSLDIVFLESILSENASRNMAMHQASDNASELKDELILIYNKSRQQQITNEIRDIVGGGD